LNKADAERLLTSYDADPVAALTRALRIVLDAPNDAWPELVACVPSSVSTRAALLVAEERTLDALARDLNEQRHL
jgi:hypothetical protein